MFGGALWASHQHARALVPNVRQFSDEQIKAVIARGGVLGVALDAWMLAPGWIRGETTPQSAGVTLAQVADHIDHIVKVAGIDHVGYGADFGSLTNHPTGLEDVSRYPYLTAELLRRGYTDTQVKKIIGGNFLRVMRRVETVSARLRRERGPSAARIEDLDK